MSIDKYAAVVAAIGIACCIILLLALGFAKVQAEDGAGAPFPRANSVLTQASTQTAPHQSSVVELQTYDSIEQLALHANTTTTHIKLLSRKDISIWDAFKDGVGIHLTNSGIKLIALILFHVILAFQWARDFFFPYRKRFENKVKAWVTGDWIPSHGDGLVMLGMALSNVGRYAIAIWMLLTLTSL